MQSPGIEHNFSCGYNNIQGLHDKNGCKIPDISKDFTNDFEVLSETWGCKCEKNFAGYSVIAQQEPVKHAGVKKGRKSGGIIVLGKTGLVKNTKVLKISENFIWCEVSRNVMKGLEKNLIFVAAYINDITSAYHDPNVFNEFSNDFSSFCSENSPVLIMGDLNSRTGTDDDQLCDPKIDSLSFIETENSSIALPVRRNCDPVVNSHGKNILTICRTYNLKILNGRSLGDPLGMNTYFDQNLGSSSIDYGICSQNFYDHVKNFMVLPQTELSDHCKIVTELKHSYTNIVKQDSYNWIRFPKSFKWDNRAATKFKKLLENSKDALNEIKQRLEAGLVKSSGENIQNIYTEAAKHLFGEKPEKKVNRNRKSKIWFNKECQDLKKQTRKLGREKHGDPQNSFLREKFKEKLKEYKKTCQSKRHSYWQNKFVELEKSLNDSKQFWETWKNCSEIKSPSTPSPIDGEVWYSHFSSLHSKKLETIKQSVSKNHPPCAVLNRAFSKKELTKILSKLKNGKAHGFDRISNEMIKNSPDCLLDLILKYINLCLDNSMISKSLCYDIIYPIFKDGSKTDPGNYRGICVSSAILKLITSLICERLQAKVDQLNLIKKNQIGFIKNSRTSDHLLALKSIVKKYVTIGKKKLYASFVDFRKAFDSVWHEGLFQKLELLGLHGKILQLVKAIYKSTKCAVKYNDKLTQFFEFTKGVRQGCPLSPLLFNLYVNDLIEALETSNSPVSLNEVTVNALMYADDLVVLAQSEAELQEKMNSLSKFCAEWKLEINTKKTKCMVFNRGNSICKANIVVNGKVIDNVKQFKYLGFTVGAKNCNFTSMPLDLSIKARRAIFALNNSIKLSMLPARLAIKIFSTQIVPILLYGAEIWVPYSNFDLQSWEKCEVEKVHTQFLKRTMGCDIHSPNHMIRGEIGRRPLICDVITRSSQYIKHVDSINGSFANLALDRESFIDDEKNVLSLVRQFTPYYKESDYLVPKNRDEIKQNVKQMYDTFWKSELNKMSKSDTYLLIKENIGFEKYMRVVKNHHHKIALSRLRMSSHPLMIEKGRHFKPSLPRVDRRCPLCKDLTEDECHFLISCPLYNDDRKHLLDSVRRTAPLFDEIPTDLQKFVFLLTNEDDIVMTKLAAFTYNSFKTRADYTAPP